MPTHPASAKARYIWQLAAWPALAFSAVAMAPKLDRARLVQGQLLGLMDAIGLGQAQEVRRDL